MPGLMDSSGQQHPDVERRLSRITNRNDSSVSTMSTEARLEACAREEPQAHHGSIGHGIEYAVAGIAERPAVASR